MSSRRALEIIFPAGSRPMPAARNSCACICMSGAWAPRGEARAVLCLVFSGAGDPHSPAAPLGVVTPLGLNSTPLEAAWVFSQSSSASWAIRTTSGRCGGAAVIVWISHGADVLPCSKTIGQRWPVGSKLLQAAPRPLYTTDVVAFPAAVKLTAMLEEGIVRMGSATSLRMLIRVSATTRATSLARWTACADVVARRRPIWLEEAPPCISTLPRAQGDWTSTWRALCAAR